MQDINEDTEWNDILRAKGIIPPKEPEVTEQALTEMIEKTIAEKQSVEGRLGGLDLDALDELEDDEDEAVLLEYRKRRMEEMRREAQEARFGEVVEISGQDYVEQVNQAGAGVWVFLHLYKSGIPRCDVINMHFRALAGKFPKAKFIKSISTTCIPNFPDTNLPGIFVYHEGKAKMQFVGPLEFPERLTCDELEWKLSRVGGLPTALEADPRGGRVRDVLMGEMGAGRRDRDSDSDSEGDW